MKRILIICLLCVFLFGCAAQSTKDTENPPITTSALAPVEQDVTVSDLTIHFTVADNMLLYYDNRLVAGYTNVFSETLAERITETKAAIGTISSAIYIDLTFMNAPPESITLVSQDRYGANPEILISNPASKVTLSPQVPYGYFAHSSMQYEWYLRIICSYPDRNIEYVVVMERNAFTS